MRILLTESTRKLLYCFLFGIDRYGQDISKSFKQPGSHEEGCILVCTCDLSLSIKASDLKNEVGYCNRGILLIGPPGCGKTMCGKLNAAIPPLMFEESIKMHSVVGLTERRGLITRRPNEERERYISGYMNFAFRGAQAYVVMALAASFILIDSLFLFTLMEGHSPSMNLLGILLGVPGIFAFFSFRRYMFRNYWGTRKDDGWRPKQNERLEIIKRDLRQKYKKLRYSQKHKEVKYVQHISWYETLSGKCLRRSLRRCFNTS